jgi:hypothetical protein
MKQDAGHQDYLGLRCVVRKLYSKGRYKAASFFLLDPPFRKLGTFKLSAFSAIPEA